MNIIKSIRNLRKVEKGIWFCSLIIIFFSSALLPEIDWLSVGASLVGATALIFLAKGDPIGQLFTIFFALLYAIVSFTFKYYGEMITYLGMTVPSAFWALITWLKNPYKECEVKIAHMTTKKWILLSLSDVAITVLMFFILKFFGTANLFVSTLSITTSFMASMLTVLRSSYYALFYAGNDIVLIVLWALASVANISYFPMVVCFMIFLINDFYGFFNWRKMKKRQKIKSR